MKNKKQSKEQIKIERLQEEIANLNYNLRSITREKDNLEKTNNELLIYKREHEGIVNSTIRSLQNENRNLLEIIRWSFNSVTTNFPFSKEKTQRLDENQTSLIGGCSDTRY